MVVAAGKEDENWKKVFKFLFSEEISKDDDKMQLGN